MERFELQPGYSISRVIKGSWHLAGGHGKVDERQAIKDMREFVMAGVTTFDCADIYTGVEALIGKFLRQYKEEFDSGDLANVQVHSKYVPDRNALAGLSKKDTAKIIERSLERLGVERLDLVQFAWWDYDFKNYVDTALHLVELQNQGKIRHIGVTNFDGKRIKELLDAGVEIAANQVQYSVLDNRPAKDMEALATAHNIPFLCYGTVAGGFLSDRYLPLPEPKEPLENRSLTKYKLIIDEFGSYPDFQVVLQVLRELADKYRVGIAEIASKYILQKPMVGGVIIGVRNIDHLKHMQKITDFNLNKSDLEMIQGVIGHAKGPNGSVYELERDKAGKHAAIMRYDLNEQTG